MSEDIRSGSCVCGAVRYAITAPFMTFQYCFCSRCRKVTGSAHAANLFVPVEQFRWLEGEEHVRRFELSTAKYWSHCFCEHCGSSLPWITRTGKAMIVPAGTLDDDPGMPPSRAIFWASRSSWYVGVDELEMHDEIPRRKPG